MKGRALQGLERMNLLYLCEDNQIFDLSSLSTFLRMRCTPDHGHVTDMTTMMTMKAFTNAFTCSPFYKRVGMVASHCGWNDKM